MKILLILILIGLIALLALRKQAPRPAAAGIFVLVALLFIVLGNATIRGCGSSGPVVIPGFHEVAGKLLGERLAQEYPDGGTVLVLMDGTLAPPGEEYSEPQEARIKGFRDAFTGTSMILEAMMIQPEGDPAMSLAAAGPPISHQRFFELLEERSDATAVISCMGVPPLVTQTDIDRAPLYVLEAIHEDEGRRLIQDELIEGGVFVRPGADWSRKPSGRMSDEEILGMRYVLLTDKDL